MSDCILWQGGRSHGYGVRHYKGETEKVHRIAWLEAGRGIPDGHVIHHVCENKLCFNLEHLECMSRRDHSSLHNDRRGITHCSSGHEYTPENTRIKGGRYRSCRTCERRRQKHYYRQQRKAAA